MNKTIRVPHSILMLALALPGAALAGEEIAARQAAAAAATQQLLQQLGGELKREMGANGPAAAIRVCRDVAPQIAGELSRNNGWRVTRVSERVRNPLLGMPDAWERKVLRDFEARAAKGESYADMHHGEVVTEAGVEFYRFMKPIGTAPVCLTCHGATEQIPEPVRMKLAESYPFDRAVGYQAGDLRGAVSILQPLDIPLVDGGKRQ